MTRTLCVMRASIAVLGLLVTFTQAIPGWAASGLVTRCYADCPVELAGCRQTFVKGRFYRDCVKRVVYTCQHAGGCGGVMPAPPTDRCRDGVFCPLGRPVCNGTRMTCERQPPARSLPAGRYVVVFCANGPVTIACQRIGRFPVGNLAVFERAMSSTLEQFLSLNGARGCALGVARVATAGAAGVNVNFSATCTDRVGNTISESVLISVRP